LGYFRTCPSSTNSPAQPPLGSPTTRPSHRHLQTQAPCLDYSTPHSTPANSGAATLAQPRKRPFAGIFRRNPKRASTAFPISSEPEQPTTGSFAVTKVTHLPPYTPPRPMETDAPSKANLKAWWERFRKKDEEKSAGALPYTSPLSVLCSTAVTLAVPEEHPVFGKPLKESLKHASVQISTANANGELYVWGYIPVVVAKWWGVLSLPCLNSSSDPNAVAYF
jgi:hypothetical protein